MVLTARHGQAAASRGGFAISAVVAFCIVTMAGSGLLDPMAGPDLIRGMAIEGRSGQPIAL
ncbi:MAG: hypothetical protein ACPGID_02680 [Rubricella sp.]